MTGAVVYVGAPVKRFKGFSRKTQRKVKIEFAVWKDEGSSYIPGEQILEAWIDVDARTPDKCYVIEARKVTIV